MIIANPLYDTVFKRLMENQRVAKFFLETLLETQIKDIQIQPQEFTYHKDLIGLRIFRLDFIALLNTKQGYKKVLIEIQKAYEYVDLVRFRNYLGEQYKKEDEVSEGKEALALITIYILGFNLDKVEAACIRVERHYRDLQTNKVLDVRDNFVERLTHDSCIVQVNRIEGSYQTKLQRLLSIFEQRYFVTDGKRSLKDYLFRDVIKEESIQEILKILELAGASPELRVKLEEEDEAWRSLDALLGNTRIKLIQVEKDLGQATAELKTTKDKLQTTKDKLQTTKDELQTTKKYLNKKDQKVQQQEQQLTEQEQKLRQQEQEIIELRKQLED